MTDSWRKLLVTSLLCYAVALAVVVVVSVLSFSRLDTIPEFQRGWIVARTLAEFLAIAPVTQAWAVLITFALVVPMAHTLPTGTSFERFGPAVIVILVMTLVFTVAYGIAHPKVVNDRLTLEESSRVADGLMDSVEAAEANQDYGRALADLDQYIVVVGESDELQERRSRLRRHLLSDTPGTVADQPDTPPTRDTAADPQELATRARIAHREEDYSTAHYLATLALSLDDDNEEAAQIAADSLRRLEEALPDAEESAQADLYRRILAAKLTLDRGETIDAYNQLRALADEHPANADIARYLAAAESAAEELSVGIDEMERAVSLPGTAHFAFVNQADESGQEIVSIGKLIATPFGLYVHNPEIMRFSPDGGMTYHLSSDYGKLIGDSLVLTVLDPDTPGGVIAPTLHHSSDGWDPETVIPLTPTGHELWLLGIASANPARASITDLVRTLRSLPSYGVITEPVAAELLYRLSLPFTFLLLSVLTLGFSWRYRSRYLARPPILTFIVVPLSPLVLLPAYMFLQFAHRILFSVLLLWTSLTVATVLLLVFEGALVAASLMYLALSARE